MTILKSKIAENDASSREYWENGFMVILHKPLVIKHWVLLVCLLTAAFGSGLASAEEEPTFKTQYMEMKPAFVTNFGGPAKKKLKYVKADISLRVTSKRTAEAVEAHMPYLRHEVVFLLSSQTEQSMAEATAQDVIRQAALKAINDVLKQEAGEGIEVDDLLFTNFVVQR